MITDEILPWPRDQRRQPGYQLGVCLPSPLLSCVIELRGPANDLLHPVVREGLAALRGVLAGNATWRAEVVPKPKPETPDAAEARRAQRLTRRPRLGLTGERRSLARRRSAVLGGAPTRL